ncbi:MAG: hypothetical protein KC493_05170 [Bacteriovoracaceae bacterium]|nr:hypothetical protein [Bacteriovoracaceae bacterium]
MKEGWVLLVTAIASPLCLYFSNQNIVNNPIDKEYLIGNIIEIPVGIGLRIDEVLMISLIYPLMVWVLSKQNIVEVKKKILCLSVFPILLYGLFLVNSLILRMIVLDLVSLIVVLGYLDAKYSEVRQYYLLKNGVCSAITMLTIVFFLQDFDLKTVFIRNVLIFIYLIVRLGFLEELFHKSKKDDIPVESRLSSNLISVIGVFSVMQYFLTSVGWNHTYMEDFFIFISITFPISIYLILNNERESQINRLSQLKFVLLFICILNCQLIETANYYIYFQLLLFFFVREVFESYLYKIKDNAVLTSVYWLLIFILVGPFPFLPMQERILSVLKIVLEKQPPLGILGILSLLAILSSLPRGLFKKSEFSEEKIV